MAKPTLVSGIQPTGKLHLGNYLGALKHFVELQNSGKYRCYFFIADLHSLTGTFNPKEKSKQILGLCLDYLAAGLNPRKSTIFVQSAVPAHSELAWIFSTVTPLGELRRMTQFKEKSEHDPKNVNVGLFTYPILMAVDILIYDAAVVPVGDDQLQHLELTRTLARRFNDRFGKTFTEPEPLLTEAPRLMSLNDPTKKMSKSRPEGCLFLDDPPAVVRSKVRRAVTDSGREITYDPEHKPAISNLILIHATLSGVSIKQAERAFRGKTYAEFKQVLAEIVARALTPFQERKRALTKRAAFVRNTLRKGSIAAGKVATAKLAEVKQKVGLVA